MRNAQETVEKALLVNANAAPDLLEALRDMVNRWEPDTEGLDRIMTYTKMRLGSPAPPWLPPRPPLPCRRSEDANHLPRKPIARFPFSTYRTISELLLPRRHLTSGISQWDREGVISR